MKILAIRGKNLASLAGEFAVDFTVEPLCSAGIFAITGTTGAGKSTLLDALCLALFDATPRMMKAREAKVELADASNKTVAQSDSRSVLRRGTGDGYAEVDFVALTRQVYRATWSVARTGGRPGGTLRPVQLRLVNLSEGREEAGTKKELLARIHRLIGLSFEQFNRSVLLAQGDFALFLKAKQAEKAEILEKLTGTDIYSRVSTSIYNKTRMVETDYKVLQGRTKDIELLSDEALEQLRQEKAQLQEALMGKQRETETLAAALKWLEEERTLVQHLEKASQALTLVQREKEQAAPRYAALQQQEQTQEIRDVFVQTQAARRQLETVRTAWAEKEKALQQAEVEGKEALAHQEQCQQELRKWKAFLTEQEPQLNRAKELDVQLAEKQQQWEEGKAEQTHEQARQVALEKKMAELEQQDKRLHAAQQELEAWFAHYKAYSDLVPAVELVTGLLTSWETACGQSKVHRKTLTELSTLTETEQRRLQEMRDEAERLNRLQPAEVVLLRAQLRAGEPCPVCGSLHHPAASLTEVQSLQEAELKRAKERVAKEVERLETALLSRTQEITRLNAVLDSYHRQATEALNQVTDYVSILPSWQELLNRGTLKETVRKFATLWTEKQQAQTDVKEAWVKNQVAAEGMQRELETARKQWQEKARKWEELEKEIAERRAQRALLLDGRATETVVREQTARLQALEKQQDEALKKQHTLQTVHESVNGQVMQLAQERTRLQVAVTEGEQAITQWLSLHPTIADAAELQQLLARDAAWVAREKQQLDDLKERFTAAQVLYEERSRKVEEHASAPHKPSAEQTEPLLQSRLQQLKEETAHAAAQVTRIGLTEETQEKNRQALKELEQACETQRQVYENWARLNELFGSQSGVKFKEIAQGYTLDVLLLYANKHLQDLAPRYELQRIPDTLALQIADLDMMGEIRSVHSLSGGESFLVSLALALGLSSLSSNRMNVESLFIDEGFGSLDIDTLRVAMDALERLQMQGRKIGVISHVAEMTERLPAQIRVIKTGNGRSRVQVEGVATTCGQCE